MKDKELRRLIVESGLLKEEPHLFPSGFKIKLVISQSRDGSSIGRLNKEEERLDNLCLKVNRLIDHLGLEEKYIPEVPSKKIFVNKKRRKNHK